ncbi:hypothetical protein [Hamadaea tsunoensis]|uniref:hypothetical protein n=1 Tax=Hamadaea tsunoensis TaxID=53368 RepID=UPI000489CF7C|nr:hypothetical protein [Hamadaea tsunoensis]
MSLIDSHAYALDGRVVAVAHCPKTYDVGGCDTWYLVEAAGSTVRVVVDGPTCRYCDPDGDLTPVTGVPTRAERESTGARTVLRCRMTAGRRPRPATATGTTAVLVRRWAAQYDEPGTRELPTFGRSLAETLALLADVLDDATRLIGRGTSRIAEVELTVDGLADELAERIVRLTGRALVHHFLAPAYSVSISLRIASVAAWTLAGEPVAQCPAATLLAAEALDKYAPLGADLMVAEAWAWLDATVGLAREKFTELAEVASPEQLDELLTLTVGAAAVVAAQRPEPVADLPPAPKRPLRSLLDRGTRRRRKAAPAIEPAGADCRPEAWTTPDPEQDQP